VAGVLACLLLAAWAALAALTGAFAAEKQSWAEGQAGASAGIAASILSAQSNQTLDSSDQVKQALQSASSQAPGTTRAFVASASARGWQVLSDTSNSPESLVLLSMEKAKTLRPGQLAFLPDGAGSRGEIWAYVPLHSKGTLIGVAGASVSSQPSGFSIGLLKTVHTSLLLVGTAATLCFLWLVLVRGRNSGGWLPDRFLVVLEAGLVVFLVWSSFAAITAHSRLQRFSSFQAEHVQLAQAISQAMSVVDLAKDSQPIREAAQGLAQTSRPWLAAAFTDALAKEDRESLVTLLAHQSMVASEQLKRTRESIEESSAAAWQGLVILASVALGVTVLVHSRRGREKSLRVMAEAGEETKAHLDRLTDHMPIGLAAFHGPCLVDSNPAWQTLLGPTGSSQKSDWMKWIHPSDLPKILTLLSKEPNDEEQSQGPLNCRVLSPDGRTRRLELRFSLPHSAARLDGRRLVFALDSTDQEEAREALEKQKEMTEEKSMLLGSALDELEANIGSVVQCLVKAVEAKDPYTAGHSERVAEYCIRMGRYLGLGPFELRVLELGALVHDAGKIGVPDEILLKPSGLTKDEFDIIKTHPVIGEEILSNFTLFDECIPIVRWHHERLDGSGYPDGIAGEDIPFLVRISSVADAFDAMTSSRAYRSGMPPEKAISLLELDVQAGKLDPIILEALKRTTTDLGVIPQAEAAPVMPKAA